MKSIKKTVDTLAWLKIMASPLLAGIIAGALVYLPNKSTGTLVVAAIFVATGLIFGIVWANRIAKKHGSVNFLSRIIATPELDKKD